MLDPRKTDQIKAQRRVRVGGRLIGHDPNGFPHHSSKFPHLCMCLGACCQGIGGCICKACPCKMGYDHGEAIPAKKAEPETVEAGSTKGNNPGRRQKGAKK